VSLDSSKHITFLYIKTLLSTQASFESSYLGTMDDDMMERLNNAQVFHAPIKGPLIWCQQSSRVTRHPETLSLVNEDEASEVAKFSVRLAQAVGAANVLVTSVYPKQVTIPFIF